MFFKESEPVCMPLKFTPSLLMWWTLRVRGPSGMAACTLRRLLVVDKPESEGEIPFADLGIHWVQITPCNRQ